MVMSIITLLSPEIIKIGLSSSDKPAVLNELVQILVDSGKVVASDSIFEALMKREGLQSTGLEAGIAVPHAKTASVTKLVLAIGIDKNGIEFDAIDKKPSHLFFLLLSPPDKSGPHIGALAEIARLSKSEVILQKLIQSTSPEEACDLLKKQYAAV